VCPVSPSSDARSPAWDSSRSIREQDEWDEHAAFMDGLTDEGFIVLGGPLADSGRVLLITDAGDEAEVQARPPGDSGDDA
jgi:hypothetical protein